jgi:hypothetical protein
VISVFCVLRSGGEYRADHVLRLHKQVMNHLPDADFRCLSDIEVEGVRTLPLMTDWPGWWSKMELFRPGMSGDILFMDLDTSIVGNLADIVSVNRLALMRDIYRPEGLQSSIMFLPEAARERIWGEWIDKPQHWMDIYHKGGDQAFLELFWLAGSFSPTKPTRTGYIAGGGGKSEGERIPEREKERAVIVAVDGKEHRPDACRGQSRDRSGHTGILRRPLPENEQKQPKGGDRQKRDIDDA